MTSNIFDITRMPGSVLEANAKVNGSGQISHSRPSKPVNQYGRRFKYITAFAQGVDVHNLMEIDSAIMNLRVHEKTRFCVDFFFVNTSIFPDFRRGYRSRIWDDFNV